MWLHLTLPGTCSPSLEDGPGAAGAAEPTAESLGIYSPPPQRVLGQGLTGARWDGPASGCRLGLTRSITNLQSPLHSEAEPGLRSRPRCPPPRLPPGNVSFENPRLGAEKRFRMWNLRHEVTEGLEDPGLPSKGMKLHPGRIYVVSRFRVIPSRIRPVLGLRTEPVLFKRSSSR